MQTLETDYSQALGELRHTVDALLDQGNVEGLATAYVPDGVGSLGIISVSTECTGFMVISEGSSTIFDFTDEGLTTTEQRRGKVTTLEEMILSFYYLGKVEARPLNHATREMYPRCSFDPVRRSFKTEYQEPVVTQHGQGADVVGILNLATERMREAQVTSAFLGKGAVHSVSSASSAS